MEKLERAVEHPEHFLQRLVGSDEYKLRIGDHRLLCVLSPENRSIVVERVDHRSRVYNRRK
jgi:mRNA-degrading endonuclease RelE of RelBE toxin-antitoxin system